MSRVAILVLFALAGVLSTSLHASTIVTDAIVVTYAIAGATEQVNFSFVDGETASYNDSDQYVIPEYVIPVMVYPYTDQVGQPTAAEFGTQGLGYFQLLLSGGPSGSGVSITGFNYDGLLVDSTLPNSHSASGIAFYARPGTYSLLTPSLIFSDTKQMLDLDSATVNITQTTSVIPDTVAVTPEPSSLAMLGTGLLATGGLLRRRIRAAAL